MYVEVVKVLNSIMCESEGIEKKSSWVSEHDKDREIDGNKERIQI